RPCGQRRGRTLRTKRSSRRSTREEACVDPTWCTGRSRTEHRGSCRVAKSPPTVTVPTPIGNDLLSAPGPTGCRSRTSHWSGVTATDAQVLAILQELLDPAVPGIKCGRARLPSPVAVYDQDGRPFSELWNSEPYQALRGTVN